MNTIDHLKQYLERTGMLSPKELDTLVEVKITTKCDWCQSTERCATLECCKGTLCIHCLDNLVDSFNGKGTEHLFVCILCEKKCTNIKYID